MPYLNLVFNLPVDQSFTYRSDDDVPVGCRAVAMFGRRKLTGWVVGTADKPPAQLKSIRSIERAVDTEPLFGAELLDLARWLSNLTMSSLGEVLAAMLPGGRRESRALVERSEDEATSPIETLSDDQRSALEAVLAGAGERFYLYGITGSGKTEVYLRAAEDALARQRGVVYLVPEIALSHHLVEGLRKRFENRVAVIHSGLTPSRRLAEWRRIQSGEARLVLGARSAVFAPVADLGLVIIDEEHEGSYKSAAAPRYHARQVAMKRCRDAGATLLMGSATPSVEAWAMMREGKLGRLNLRGRPAGGSDPEVRIVDLTREKALFSGALIEGMNRVLGEGRQVLLFLNRRGFSYHYSCRSCGGQILCRHCSVPLTYHKSRRTMVCHYCGFRMPPPSTCPDCGSTEMKAAGFGTERIEEEVSRLFPEKRVARLDADTSRKKGVLEARLREFRNHEIDILLGTQMVAKGLNAPGVKLAAVLSADTSLNLPDFRASERTFALILQVSGRAGRFRPDGEVIVQTDRPGAAAVRLAAENRVEDFYNDEIEQRRLLGFPPFSRLFRIVVRGRDLGRVERSASDLAARLGADIGGELLGPAECPIGRISEEHRHHIILRSESFDRTHRRLSQVLRETLPVHGIRFEVDVDPVNLL